MKKIISMLLCILMLLGTMSIGAFAKEYFAGEAATTAPVIDGVVNEGEYSWTSGALNPKVPEDNRVYLGQGNTTATSAQFYLSYDSEYIYAAFVEVGVAISRVYFDFNPCAGFADSSGQVYMSIHVERGTVKGFDLYERVSASERETKTADYLVEQKGGAYDDGKVNTNTYEVKLKRSAFEAYAGDSFEKIGFRAFTQVPQGNAEVFFYADSSSSVKPLWFNTGYAYHVINLNNNGTNPDESGSSSGSDGPVEIVDNDGPGFHLEAYGQKHYTVYASESSPAVDGIIGTDEYSLSLYEFIVADDDKDDRFFDKSNGGDATDFNLFAAYDKDYIYLAATVTELTPTAWSDCAHFFLGSKNDPGSYVSCYLPLNSASKGHIEGNGIVGYEGEGATKFETEVFKKYILTTASSLSGNTATYEVAFKRSAFDNAMNLHVGFDAYANKQGYVIFGFQNDELSGYNTVKAGNIGFYPHVFEISPDFKTIDEDHEHVFTSWKRSGPTHHRRTCECGEIEYGFHSWNEGEITREPTAEREGQIKYTCTLCSTTDKDDIIFVDEEEVEIPETDVPETDAPDTDAPETDVPETDAPETEAPDTEAPETEAPATDAPTTDAPVSETPTNEGCGSSITTLGVALVTILGTCTAFVSKKR